jgi:CRISPR-associated protein Csm1
VQLLNDEQEEIGTILARLDKQDRRKKRDTWLAKAYNPISEAQEKNLLTTFRIGPNYQAAWIVNPYDVSKTNTMYLLNGTTGFRKHRSKKSGFKFLATHVDTYSEKEAKQHNEKPEKHGGYDSPERVEEGDIKGFDDMAEAGKGGFLGILRMDVDHLGAVFSIGIPKEKQNISRIASLSSDMELFFTGYFQNLCKIEFKKNTYIAYSGGDDLFVAGAWDTVLDLACKVRKDFKAFTCQNKDMNISGGLFLCKGKYPIHRAAEQAEHLLNDLAKENEKCEENLKGNITKRDAIAIFNHRMVWREFIDDLKRTGEDLIEAIEGKSGQKKLKRTYLYKLFDLHRTWKTYRQLNVARLFYITVRNIENVMYRQKLLKHFGKHITIKQLRKHIYLENPSYIPILIGYATLKTRK